VEFDKSLAEVLQELMPPGKAYVTWHIKSILDVKWHDFYADSSFAPRFGRCLKVVGNIPYNISSPLLFHLIESHKIIERAVLMVQREVGMRWTAQPSTKDYGIPTVILKNCAEAEKLFAVGHGQFLPPPRVESLVVRIKFFDAPQWAPLSYAFFHGLVSTLFRQRRKTVLNGLKSFCAERRGKCPAMECASACLEKASISPSARPEELSPEDFVRLAKCLACGTERPD
jgi:16S rRNA (adenine1518-N6/adenine1519-N6)-dimethyltransferase